jgi:hypothetical protein
MALAAKLSPLPVEEIMEEIPDPEIRTFETITLTNALLGADIPSLSIMERHKNGAIGLQISSGGPLLRSRKNTDARALCPGV